MSNDTQAARQPRHGLQLERFVVSVDGQRKIGYRDESAAQEAAAKLRADFPVLTVTVDDQEDEIIRERP